MAENAFDVIIVGGGPGGYVAAIRAAQLGLNTAVVEEKHLGGICLNWGCIPTKALLRSSEIYHYMQNAGAYGLSAKDVSFDMTKVVKRSRQVSRRLNGGVAHLLKKNKVTVVMGRGRLKAPGAVVVAKQEGGEETLTAKHIILATGARPRELPGLEPDGKLVWTYFEALVPERLPKSLLVIGSGAIGIEFASFYRKVTNLKRGKDTVSATITDANGKSSEMTVERVISAVGVVGNVEDLGLENTKVKTDRGCIVADAFSRTDEPGIYAIGDVAGPPMLAHKAEHEGVICIEKIAGLDPHPLEKGRIPGCTYCQPQIASVGLSEMKAKEAGREVRVGRFPFVGNGKAIALGEPDGLVKTVFDAATGELLGAHMVGAEVTELIQGFVVAMGLETTEEDLMHTVFPHPTLSEMMHESVLDAYGRVIHF
jgi:dihydrolipoamide dehydrogenase